MLKIAMDLNFWYSYLAREMDNSSIVVNSGGGILSDRATGISYYIPKHPSLQI